MKNIEIIPLPDGTIRIYFLPIPASRDLSVKSTKFTLLEESDGFREYDLGDYFLEVGITDEPVNPSVYFFTRNKGNHGQVEYFEVNHKGEWDD